jgi:DNA-directed RNA polymerase beta' subunit
MEEPVRRLLGLTGKQFEDVLAGKEELQGKKGPQAVVNALSRINVDQAIVQARADVTSGRRTLRDEAVRRLGYLKAAKKSGIHPSRWVLTKVPVLPPAFRPVSVMRGTGGQLVSDANYLYKEVFDANHVLAQLKGITDDVGDERLNLYKSFKGVTGLGDPVQPKNKEKKVRGMLQQIFGHSPKWGSVQQKLLGTTVDLVGRAVVTPNPDLDMDQIGLPESRAWEVYTPFVTRRLVRRGVPRLQALQYVKDRDPIARKALMEELEERPVLVNRAPVLHKYGLMAFHPRLTKGDVLQVSPIIVGGFGMDFDGDAANYHVPASDEARDEALAKMLPSHNLISVATLKRPMYVPRQEYLGGLFAATSGVNLKSKPRVFASVQDAVRAYHRGDLHPDQKVEIINHGR